jgi:hypothetical protein
MFSFSLLGAARLLLFASIDRLFISADLACPASQSSGCLSCLSWEYVFGCLGLTVMCADQRELVLPAETRIERHAIPYCIVCASAEPITKSKLEVCNDWKLVDASFTLHM